MGRHQRRGYVGQTNLSPPHKHEQHDRLSPTRSHADPLIPISSHSPTASPLKPPSLGSRKRQPRPKWRLDLQPLPHAPVNDQRALGLHGDNIEAQLAAHIAAIQHDRKSFKDEQWYRSPIGAGSKSSVVLAALKQHDHRDTGFLPRSSIFNALQQSHIGLSEHQIQTLLHRYDPAQELIHYKTFVKHLHFTEASEPTQDEHDVIYRHQTYLEKIHQHAASLIEQTNDAASNLSGGSPSKSPLRLSPVKPSAPMITNNEPSVIVGNSPMHSPSSRLAPLGFERSSPSRYDLEGGFDPLSFENDKSRKAQRAQAKATVLLAHISRIDDYARHQDVVSLQHDNLRIASKALHHGEHLARVFNEEHRQLHRLENQGKALVDSPLKQAQRSVSKDSMFYVDPKGG